MREGQKAMREARTAVDIFVSHPELPRIRFVDVPCAIRANGMLIQENFGSFVFSKEYEVGQFGVVHSCGREENSAPNIKAISRRATGVRMSEERGSEFEPSDNADPLPTD